MNNKARGTAFERRFVQILAGHGFWAHFIEPNKNGAQPFDVIALKYGKVWAFDCKTTTTKTFPLSRLEENQILAFEKIMRHGCDNVYLAVSYNDEELYLVDYNELKANKKVVLNESNRFEQVIY